jgi:rhodanese-related sulfurtransferase
LGDFFQTAALPKSKPVNYYPFYWLILCDNIHKNEKNYFNSLSYWFNRKRPLTRTGYKTGVDNGNIQVLDVRTAGEYQGGHLKKAFLADWTNQEQFKDRTQYLDKTKPVYVYCLSGGRSAAAAQWLQQQGYSNVYSLKGGINAWKQANKAVEGNANIKQMSLDEYKALINGNDTYLVDFGAEWCLPCKKMEPVLETLVREAGTKFKLIKVDAGVHLNVMKELKVDALPVFIIYKNRKEVWRKQGITSIEAFKANLLAL